MTVRYPLVLNGTSIQELQSGDSLNGLTSSTAIQKGNGTGGLTAASSGTDFAPATPGGQNPLASNGSGGFNAITIASPLSWNSATNTIGYSGGTGSGSVVSVGLGVPTGFSVSGTPVTTSGTLSFSVSASGLLKGSAGGITPASSSDITSLLGFTPVSTSGSGASGTWGISISGNATTASSPASGGSFVTTSTITGLTAGSANSLTYSGSTQLAAGGSGLTAYAATTIDSSLTLTGGNELRLGTSSGQQFKFYNYGAGTRMFVDSPSGSAVYINNGGTTWVSASDESVKDIIEPITNATVKLSTLRTVIGKYKREAVGARHPFLIAQDVLSVYPEAVDIDPLGEMPMGLAYPEMIPLIVASIKELAERITALETNPV